ncbi:MAG: CBS domain-containing protein [Polyangiaceae bacterium]|nr:CBS domain-containing protein [Polyangiaceae bacterium]
MKGHAREIMAAPVPRITVETELVALADALGRGSWSGLPVVGPDDGVLGFVSATDVMIALVEQRPAGTTAAELMSSPAEVIDEFTGADEVMAFLRRRRIHHAPVVRAGRLVGMISAREVLRYFVEHVAPRPPDAG